MFDTKIMATLLDRPSVIRNKFRDLYQNESSEAATDYFYKLSCDSNYIRRQRIKKDQKWTTETDFGTLDVLELQEKLVESGVVLHEKEIL